jgi:nicotinamide mononucleotide (NMN) deamidase PncC
MDGAVKALVAALHGAPWRVVLALSGGGATATSQLLAVPGASRTVLELTIPYSEQALAEYLGHIPESFCSTSTAQAMATRALQRARRLAPGDRALGVGCTASLRSDRPKRGDHRFHLAFETCRGVTTHSVVLKKDARDREEEEALVAAALLNGLAEAFEVSERVPLLLQPGEELIHDTLVNGHLAEFLSGNRSVLCIEPDGRMNTDALAPQLLLPGSFNPLHHGHVTLAAVASEALGTAVAFEMTVINADKPPTDDEEVRRRLASFAWRAPLWLTRAPTFPAKARLFPGAVFVVGADTAARIVDPRFYGGSARNRDDELAEFRSRGSRFLVAGRADGQGRFLELEDLSIPESLRDLFTGIPPHRFRQDISSTRLRSGADA